MRVISGESCRLDRGYLRDAGHGVLASVAEASFPSSSPSPFYFVGALVKTRKKGTLIEATGEPRRLLGITGDKDRSQSLEQARTTESNAKLIPNDDDDDYDYCYYEHRHCYYSHCCYCNYGHYF